MDLRSTQTRDSDRRKIGHFDNYFRNPGFKSFESSKKQKLLQNFLINKSSPFQLA